jgi:hypothetical protein
MSQLKERIAGMSLDRRALLEQRLLQVHGLRGRRQSIPRRKPEDPAWLSFGQQQMWFLDQLTPGTSTYNIPDAVQVRGTLDIEALEKSLQEIVRRHEVLRTHLASVDGNPVPVIDERWEMKVGCLTYGRCQRRSVRRRRNAFSCRKPGNPSTSRET